MIPAPLPDWFYLTFVPPPIHGSKCTVFPVLYGLNLVLFVPPGDTRAMLRLPLRHLFNYLLSQGSVCIS